MIPIIREAKDSDAHSIAILLTELGYPRDVPFVTAKLTELRAYPTVKILVAELDDHVVGVIGFDSHPLFHQNGKIGTITALAVDDEYHGRGVGRALVEHVEQMARNAGCIKIAVASGKKRDGAHKFYRALGYEETTSRFLKQLTPE